MLSDVSSRSPRVWRTDAEAQRTDVVNGERNKILLNVENQSDRNITIKSVAGSFHHPQSHSLVKNVSVCLAPQLCSVQPTS